MRTDSAAARSSPHHARDDARRFDRAALLAAYRRVRSTTLRLADPLSPEDMTVQPAAHASPAKWHLAHTTWFFETFVLEPHEPGFRPYAEAFRVLFNSYYNAVGPQHPRPFRGMITRPGAGEVLAYRDTVDERIDATIRRMSDDAWAQAAPVIELGLHHEQQHQELILTDVLALFRASPLEPAYRPDARSHPADGGPPAPIRWLGFADGVREIGWSDTGFCYDNECPRHRRFLEAFAIADRPLGNAEVVAFIEDGGYDTGSLWLDDGWSMVRRESLEAPLGWRRDDDAGWTAFTLAGREPVRADAPAVHLSFFEADAICRWLGARLPTEAEWEVACTTADEPGELLAPDPHAGGLRPRPLGGTPAPDRPRRMIGDVWEWTRSAHEPYPGYRPPAGALAEYNGKFMSGTNVLRGGSCFTPDDHIRPTYRNFFAPDARWQASGVRPARDA